MELAQSLHRHEDNRYDALNAETLISYNCNLNMLKGGRQHRVYGFYCATNVCLPYST